MGLWKGHSIDYTSFNKPVRLPVASGGALSLNTARIGPLQANHPTGDTVHYIAGRYCYTYGFSKDTKVAVESTRLPGEFHKDPADRMIMALARTLSTNLVAADENSCLQACQDRVVVGYKVPMYRLGLCY